MPPDDNADDADCSLAVSFADLFDNLGTDLLRYSGKAEALSGRRIAIDGFLAHGHGDGHAHGHAHAHAPAALMLVDQPGQCPDCSPAPAAVIALVDARLPHDICEERIVRVTGRLDFGFRIDGGVATFIRIEQAAIGTPAA